MEIWKEVPGFETAYHVSNLGRIKSLARLRNAGGGSKHLTKEKILKEYISVVGYVMVTLSANGSKKKDNLHRIIATAFIPNPNNLETVNHKNGIKTDNRVENLEWASYAENNKHAYATKLKIPYKRNGVKNPKSKLTPDKVIGIRKLLSEKVPYKEVAERFSVSVSCLEAINCRHTWGWL